MPYLNGGAGCLGQTGCATVARLLGGNPAGTASRMTSWLLIEQPGAWSADAVQKALTRVIDDDRLADLRAAGLRPLLIRRPGKQMRTDDYSITVYVGADRPGARWLERVMVRDMQALAELDLEAVAEGRPGHGQPVDGPLFLVCTHGSKDMCCAVLGRPVAKELARDYPDRVWEVSHVGGDRWAGNLLVVPDGFLHGQLTPPDATLVAKDALAGRVHPDYLRGRTSAATAWEQCAEIAVRRHTGLSGVDEVRAASTKPGPRPTSRTVSVTARDQAFEVLVRHRTDVASEDNRCTGRISLAEYSASEIRRADVTAPQPAIRSSMGRATTE